MASERCSHCGNPTWACRFEQERVLAESVVEAARKASESYEALKRLDDEGYRLPTPEWERLQDIAYERGARMNRLREALAALDAHRSKR